MFNIANFDSHTIMITAKYVIASGACVMALMAPAWLAEKNKKNALTIMRVRAASWLFGWTGIGYFYSLYLAAAPDKNKNQ